MKKRINGFREHLADKWRVAAPALHAVWKSYGYYISLACLLALFGMTAYIYRSRNEPDAVMTSGSAKNYASAPEAVFATCEPTPAPTPYAPHFSMPVSGTISASYSPQELVWNETLGQWLVHEGIDIAANAGTVVIASESGTVSAAYEDDMYGMTVEITHGDGWLSRYCSLESLQLAEVGNEVQKGDVIGAVGNSGIAESCSGAHLHFEITRNGASVEPEFE